MSHYGNSRESEALRELKAEKASLEEALKHFREYRWSDVHHRRPPALIQHILDEAEKTIKARLYDLREY